MIPSEHTINKLRELNAYMLAEPRRVNMDVWGSAMDPKSYAAEVFSEDEDIAPVLIQKPPCGAVGCMAGCLCIMAGEIVPSQHFDGTEIYEFDWNTPSKAASILGLSDNEASKLFFLKSWGREVGWSSEFSDRLEDCAPGTKEYVQVLVDRNEHYIATGE